MNTQSSDANRLPALIRVKGQTMWRLILISILMVLGASPNPVFAQQDKVRDYRRANEHRIFAEFVTLLSIPNVASDRENIRKNAGLILEMMKRRGLEPRLLEASDSSAPPAVYGEWKSSNPTRTIILYAHYDGQPTDPRQWSGTQPWQPTLRSAALEAKGTLLPMPKPGETIDPEWRLYARSASDDEAGRTLNVVWRPGG